MYDTCWKMPNQRFFLNDNFRLFPGKLKIKQKWQCSQYLDLTVTFRDTSFARSFKLSSCLLVTLKQPTFTCLRIFFKSDKIYSEAVEKRFGTWNHTGPTLQVLETNQNSFREVMASILTTKRKIERLLHFSWQYRPCDIISCHWNESERKSANTFKI